MRFEEALKLARETGCGFRYKGRDDYFHFDDTELSNISMRIIVEMEWEIKHVETFAWGVQSAVSGMWLLDTGADRHDACLGNAIDMRTYTPTFPFENKALADGFSAAQGYTHVYKATIQRCPENDK